MPVLQRADLGDRAETPMTGWARRVRGALGIGALWGAAGATLGALGALMSSVFGGIPSLGTLVEFTLGAGGFGFVLGFGFAGALSLMEKRRTLDELSPRRAALLGAVVGAAFPFLMLLTAFLPEVGGGITARQMLLALFAGSGSYSALSAALAAGTVAIAQRAPPVLQSGSERELTTGDAEARAEARVELT